MKSVMKIDQEGNKEWRNAAGELHRENGPAVIRKDDAKFWYVNGNLHRVDGPAVEWADGGKTWWINGVIHRDDGPAVEDFDGTKKWYFNGKRHREDGPSREWADGTKEWHLNGKTYTKKMYYRKMKGKIKEKIGAKVAEMFGFDKKYSWKRLWNRMETRALADFLEDKGDIRTANQIRNLINFHSGLLAV